MTGDQLQESDNIRKNIDHLTDVANAIDAFRRRPDRQMWKAIGKLLMKGNKYPSRLQEIGSPVIASQLQSKVMELRDAQSDRFAKLHTKAPRP